MARYFRWDVFFKVVCGASAIVFLSAVVVKLARPASLSEVKLETLLLILGAIIMFPYISQLEAFGVKMEIKKKVDDLAARVQALPDYVLASEYHWEGDYTLAERAYRASMERCSDFWPAIFGLAGVFHDREEYDKAIMEYNRVLTVEPNNVYVLNNLADVYLSAPQPIMDPSKALDMANQAIQIVPSLGSALYYKGEALNRLGSFDQARSILSGILAKDMLPAQPHWVMYELSVANSNLGTRISEECLDRMLFYARDNSQGKRFLDALASEEEHERFNEDDVTVIRRFVEKNENYIEDKGT
ncbi:MAG: tetratricopeptide repeat protein [Pseudomonadota bacterium]